MFLGKVLKEFCRNASEMRSNHSFLLDYYENLVEKFFNSFYNILCLRLKIIL